MDKDDVVCVYNGILLSHKNNEIMSFAATWMDLEMIIHSEVSQRQRQISYGITYMGSIERWCKWIYLQNRNRLIDIENIYGHQRGEGEG